jgi:hypothetical protein
MLRYILAAISFVLAAPLLGYFAFHMFMLIDSGFFSLPAADLKRMWLLYLFLGVSAAFGFTFLIAGVAILATRPKAKR